jgi:Flp pilus assembly protein TadD
MASSTSLISRLRGCLLRGFDGRVCAPLLAALLLSGCVSQSVVVHPVDELPPLQLPDRTLEVAGVTQAIVTPDLLATDQPMRDFVARYTSGLGNTQQRLMSLHRAVRGAGIMDIQYDPFAEGTAQEVFQRGSANCLSYANLFIAMAREAGLDARYQWLEVRPQWSRVGDRVLVGLHVNAVVRLRGGARYMVDIDPLPARDIAGSQEISDADAAALYHSNIAMDALAAEDLESAWQHAVRALQLSPQMSHLWVNLGAIYRLAGQYQAAETSYLQALALDEWQYSAMANLTVLYGLQGREQEQAHWQQRVEHYRQTNPYYYAELGEDAGQQGDWEQALRYYNRAIELLPGDSELLFARGLVYYQLDELNESARDLKKAIERASLRSDAQYYESYLEKVRRAQLAGV